MKHEPKPAIHMEKYVGWACKLGGVDLLRTYKVGQTVVYQLMESQIWHQLAGSVGGGFRKGTMASVPLEVRHFSPPSIPLVPFKLLPCCWNSEGVSLSK